MGNTHEYNPDVWWECALAYWVKAHNPEVKLKATRESSATFEWDKDKFKKEDDTYPEVVNFMFADEESLEYQSFACGVELTEYDPSTPGGWGFWSEIFNTEDLKKVAIESADGVAYGKWDALRQVMNMGQIAYITKYNLCVNAIMSDVSADVTKEIFGYALYNIALKSVKKGG